MLYQFCFILTLKYLFILKQAKSDENKTNNITIRF